MIKNVISIKEDNTIQGNIFTGNVKKQILNICRKYKDKPIYIIGHDYADVDSILSMHSLLFFLVINEIDNVKIKYPTGYNIPKETSDILEEQFMIDDYEFKDLSDGYIILVDHHNSDYDNIIGCIDHHPTDEYKNQYDFYINCNASSCCKLIYDIFFNDLPHEDKTIMELVDMYTMMTIFSIYMDTVSCTSDKFIKSDEDWISRQAKRLGVDLELYNKLGLSETNLDISLD